ncbi:GntR family transcriptional regulator [Ponticoccus alexandrii]|uniref:FCD domain-containing protein n=1 Tax=Ponticoccus alexandrii TaxID=1943633 RepID=A0ABX7FBS6_9RHOB|nr:GntR family transcriptional regulator [Ponticoccus alexandrii]ETA51784.1 GntR family transcriptional regulator [Rhodobacteraceae bacterium PD-2]QRF67571.1 FCD domain-containing protein [Ponticoccus alexandrii]
MTPSAKPENASAHDRVYRGLRTRIMLGQIPPGQALTLRGLGREFGVSMTPAREAVNRLVAEGALSMSSSGRVQTPELSNERIEELAALRALIEVELASRALPRAHMALIERLQTINNAITDVVSNRDAVGYIRSNLEFHRTLYLRAQAPAMLAMAETVWLQLGPTMRELYGRLRRTEAPQYHRLIIAALKAGDEPSLRLAVRSDVTQGLRMLVS